MHDWGFVREHPEVVEKMVRDRGIALDLALFRELDAERRKIITSTGRMKADRNKASEEIAVLKKAEKRSSAGPSTGSGQAHSNNTSALARSGPSALERYAGRWPLGRLPSCVRASGAIKRARTTRVRLRAMLLLLRWGIVRTAVSTSTAIE